MIIVVEGATADQVNAARRSFETLARSWVSTDLEK